MLMMKSLAQEVAPQRIRVNSISPGAIRTPINTAAWSTPEAYAALMRLIPYKRIGEPDDIGKAAIFLASDESDYITGTSMYVDGGMTLYPEFASAGRWQLSVFRSGIHGDAAVLTRRIASGTSEVRQRPMGGGLEDGAWISEGQAPDPTRHLTFMSAASRDVGGQPIWTDLAWSQLDQMLPADRRRVVVSVQKAVENGKGRLIGVVRAALLASAIDSVSALQVGKDDPHRIFITDADGRLITRLSPQDRLTLVGDDLRIAPEGLPPAISLALRGPLLDEKQGVERTGELQVDGERWLATFRALAGSQDWFVGVVVPESAYTRELRAVRVRLLMACAVIIGLVLLGGGLGLFALRRGLGRIGGGAARMRMLDFAASPVKTPFRDIHAVLSGLEQAKAAVRGLGEVAPRDLV